jgi:hypothetical protein
MDDKTQTALKALAFIGDNTVAYPNPYQQAQVLEKAFHIVRAAICRPVDLTQGVSIEHMEYIVSFLDSFRIGVNAEQYYKDVSICLINPHSFLCRVHCDSTKSWIFADLEKRRQNALATACAYTTTGE